MLLRMHLQEKTVRFRSSGLTATFEDILEIYDLTI